MKTVEIEKLLAVDPLAVFAFKPTRRAERDHFMPVYIRGIRRTIHGRWKFAEVKRTTMPEGVWRKESGSFRPGEIITVAEAEEIVRRNEERDQQRAKQSIKVMCAAGRMRLHGYVAEGSDAGVVVDPDLVHRLLDVEGRGVHWESLSFCETTAGYSWHIRCLSMAGRKPSGGCDTLALGGAKAAWDVGAPVTKTIFDMEPGGMGAPCSACVTVIKEAM